MYISIAQLSCLSLSSCWSVKYELKYNIGAHLFQLSSISPVVLQLFPTVLAQVAGSCHPLCLRKQLIINQLCSFNQLRGKLEKKISFSLYDIVTNILTHHSHIEKKTGLPVFNKASLIGGYLFYKMYDMKLWIFQVFIKL